MESIKIQLCECGCGKPAPVATRNWHKRGIKKGQFLRFICGHHRRGKEQSKQEKLKRARAWGRTNCIFSPYLPGNKLVHYKSNQKRWYCHCGTSRTKPHARMVYEHYFGKVPEDYVIHHKSGSANTIEDDRPDNLLAIPKIWNLHYLPLLAKGFGKHESVITAAYIEAIENGLSLEQDIFKKVCQLMIVEK